jgi:hypothetical protein
MISNVKFCMCSFKFADLLFSILCNFNFLFHFLYNVFHFILLGCYILCNKILVEESTNDRSRGVLKESQMSRLVDQVKLKLKFKAFRHGKGIDIKSKRSTNKRSIGGRATIE